MSGQYINGSGEYQKQADNNVNIVSSVSQGGKDKNNNQDRNDATVSGGLPVEVIEVEPNQVRQSRKDSRSDSSDISIRQIKTTHLSDPGESSTPRKSTTRHWFSTGDFSKPLGQEMQNPFDDPKINPTLRNPTSSHGGKNKSKLDNVIEENNKLIPTFSNQSQAYKKRGKYHQTSSARRASYEDIEDEWQPLHQVVTVKTDDGVMTGMDSDQTYDGGETDDDDDDDDDDYNNNNNNDDGNDEGQATQRDKIISNNSFENHQTPGIDNNQSPAWAESSSTTPRITSEHESPFEGISSQYELVSNSPIQYRGGILSTLLNLTNSPAMYPPPPPLPHTPVPSPPSHVPLGVPNSRTRSQRRNDNGTSLDVLPPSSDSSVTLGSPNGRGNKGAGNHKSKKSRRGMGSRLHSSSIIDSAKNKFCGRQKFEEEIKITIHISEVISRQNYLLKLCHALMSFGAPTHRLEEYMRMSARVLEIQGSFLYIPGCMIISFDDVETHTTDVRLVKTPQGVNLGLLKDIHEIYKEVVHDVIGVEEATQRLDKLNSITPKYNAWVLVVVYGLASAAVAPFAFDGRYIDMPICFILGCILGFLQLIVAPKSDMYSNVFEISAAVLTSFLARAFGSIQNGNLFCFSAMAQSSIALILPGYMVLCGSLELQSRSMVAGSVRMVYAIIYSLFLGFGITIGTAFYGLLDPNATSATTCADPGMSDYEKWPWVPVFTLCLSIINQAKWDQTPVMLLIGFAGYIVNFFSAKRFPSSAQISNALGALAVGVLGNLYSRMRHGVAAAALLPAIFVQVPSGLAASGSLLSGLSTAEKITNTSDVNGTVDLNGTSSVGIGAGGFSHYFHTPKLDQSPNPVIFPLMVAVTSSEDLNTIVFNVGYSMIQIAIGITVGLFLSALIIYPFGKRRSGLFTF